MQNPEKPATMQTLQNNFITFRKYCLSKQDAHGPHRPPEHQLQTTYNWLKTL